MQRTSIGWAIAAALLGIPLIEVALFVVVGGAIGLWPTVGLVIATAIVGTALIRRQGLAILDQARVKLDRGEPPVGDMFHAMGLVIAGVLLLTPGFLTDTLGFILLVPAVRSAFGRFLWARLGKGERPGATARDDVIDGDYTRVDPAAARARRTLPPGDSKESGPNPDSPWKQP